MGSPNRPSTTLVLICLIALSSSAFVDGDQSKLVASSAKGAFVVSQQPINHRLDPNSLANNNNNHNNQSTDLIAIGAVTLLPAGSASPTPIIGITTTTTTIAPSLARQQVRFSAASGRLVDRIASASDQTSSGRLKLDYIIDFMRSNSLDRFAGLLSQPEASELVNRLNGMNQFTLFVPTNEALRWRFNTGSERSPRQDQLRQFLAGHACGDLIVPRPQQLQNSTANHSLHLTLPAMQTFTSLAGNRLRAASFQRAGKLEMVVEGAQVMGGLSHALQEPGTAATYAVVHLVDRPLWPPTELTLSQQLARSTPTMLRLLERTQRGRQLLESASLSNPMSVLAPSEPSWLDEWRLLDQLEANLSLLNDFVGSHLIDGLHFGAVLHLKSPLRSIDGSLSLDFRQPLATSQLTVNGISLLEIDQMATNGLVHVIARPLVRPFSPSIGPISGERLWSAASSSDALEREQASLQPETGAANTEKARPGGSLVARNNRDFYRPSLSPTIVDSQAAASVAGASQLAPEVATANPFEADRYKIVLSAASRQRSRAQFQQQQQQQGVETTSGAASASQFVYDTPLGKESSMATAASQQATKTSLESPFQRQPLIKFRPEDARDQLQHQLDSYVISEPGTRITGRPLPAYESTQPSSGKQQTPETPSKSKFDFKSSSTSGGSPLSNCASYDTQCRRAAMLSRLVRLPAQTPAARARQVASQRAKNVSASTSGSAQLQANPSNHQMSSSSSSANLDSSFGESASLATTERPPIQPVDTPLGSLLNQPLPPWTNQEERRHLARLVGSSGSNWRDTDIARLNQTGSALGPLGITSSSQGISFTSGISRAPPGSPPSSSSSAQIVLVPVELLPVVAAARRERQQTNSRLQSTNHNILFHTPTPIPVSMFTTHRPNMFGAPSNSSRSHHHHNHQQQQQQLGRLTNFSFLEPPVGSPNQLPVLEPQTIIDHPNGDISITSARLHAYSNHTNNNNNQLLATQASNSQAVRSVGVTAGVDVEAGHQSSSSAEFFQNRTIAEIMEDSGLRIDGQQVTFSRLRDCLEEANLLGVLGQTGNALTIFMPTDLAYERLVQMQAIYHERQLAANQESGSSTSGRLKLDQQRRNLLPLIARRGRAQSVSGGFETTGSGSKNNNRDPFSVDEPPFVGAAGERLSLDCSAPQVRQLLLDHLSGAPVSPKQLQTDLGVAALSGRKLLLSSVPSKKIVVVDGQPVIAATRAKNGMVYVVNKFLNLTNQLGNVVELMDQQPNLTTFVSYLRFSGLSDRLKRESGPITVLAPTNEAFEQLSSSARQLINSDPSALMDILRSHVVEGAQFGKLIPMRSQLRTMNSDQTIEARVVKPNLYMLDKQVSAMRLLGTTGNGVVNSVDRLVVPAWLRIGGGTSSQSRPPVALPPSSSSSSLAEPTRNLPPIASRPVQFERVGLPEVRQNATSSFLLAGGSSDGFSSVGDASLSHLKATNDQLDNNINIGIAAANNKRLENGWSSSWNRTNPVGLNGSNSSAVGSARNLELVEKLCKLMQHFRFAQLLKRSRVWEQLKPDMNYVILVPTDQALDKLPQQIVEMLERDSERLADLIGFHLMETTFEYINTIPDGQTLNSLNEKDVVFNWHRNNSVLTASGAVVLGGVQEDNIAVLLVDRVLYPTPGDIWSIVAKSPILSNFTTLIKNAKLEQQLALAGPFTLFAPSDAAFNQLERRDLDFLLRNRDTARRFLLRHLSQPAVFTSAIALANGSAQSTNSTATSGSTLPAPQLFMSNSLGEELALRQRSDFFSVNDVNFSYADVAATNGVVHVIDGLL